MSVPRSPAFDPSRHHRRSIRKRTHDYTSPGLYFVTFCTRDRRPWFGRVVNDQVLLNEMGRIAHAHWLAIPRHYSHVQVHAFTIMPDHVHGIIELTGRPHIIKVGPIEGRLPLGPAPGSLGAIVGSYRAGVVRAMNSIGQQRVSNVWQRGYYDIIVRDKSMAGHVSRYIQRHPAMVL